MKKVGIFIGRIICTCALWALPLASDVCRAKFYQPEKPEGIEKLRKSK